MKIAYLINHNISLNDGITKKILGQINEWEILGHKVIVYCNTPIIGDSILSKAIQYKKESPLFYRILFQKNLYSDISSFNPDLIYFRYDSWNRTLSKLMKNFKVVTELNTLDLSEFYAMMKNEKTLKSILRYYSYKLLRSKVLKNVKGIIGVTNEIINDKSNMKFKKPSICIPNGINLNDFQTIKPVSDSITKKALFFIGSPGALWHGEDIIANLAYKLPQYEFHIVGIEGDNSQNLFWHGFLDRKVYIEILKKCHICISTMGLFRKNMKEACPLKAREYLAYGYPIIIGYEDTAFMDNDIPNWVCQIDPSKDLDFDKIRNFVENYSDKIIDHKSIEFISTKILEKKRIEFLEKINLNV
jgi:hypothetical protein